MLSSAFDQGRVAAFERFGVKVARGTTGLPQGGPMHPVIAQMHADLHGAPHAAPAAAPAHIAPPSTSWADMHHSIAQQQAANINPHPAAMPAPLPAARAFVGQGAAAAGGGTQGGGMFDNWKKRNDRGAVPPAPPTGGGSGGGGVGRFMRPMGKALGYGALAGGAALAYGMHRQNQDDRDAHNLVYAPMEGTYR